jgi:hypothetical protein
MMLVEGREKRKCLQNKLFAYRIIVTAERAMPWRYDVLYLSISVPARGIHQSAGFSATTE